MMRYIFWRLMMRPAFDAWRRVRIAFGRCYVARFSGKQTKRQGFLHSCGETRFVTLPLVGGTVLYTIQEMEGMTIPCAWCRGPIFVGDDVTLCGPLCHSKYIPPEGSVAYATDPQEMVGCGRCEWDEVGPAYAGKWVPDDERPGHGKVERIISVYEAFLANPQATHAVLTTGKGGRTLKLFDV